MACFDQYILVRGHCGTAVPSTNLYINDLEGITLTKGAAAADEETVTGVNLLNRCIEWGITNAKHHLKLAMMNVVQFDSIIHQDKYGYFSTTYLPTSATERGLKITLADCCQLSRIFVKNLTLKSNTTITGKTLKIIDGVTETTYTVDLTAGVPLTIYPNYKATENEIQIVWNTSDISVNESTIFNSDCNNCNFCHDFNCVQNGYGVNGITVTGSDNTNNSYGIQGLIQVRCDEDAFFCMISDKMSYLALYEAGLQFLREISSTERLNVFTQYGQERRDMLYVEWQKKAEEQKKLLVNELPTFLATVDKCCVNCNSSRWVYAKP